jgi:hypothetical protein
MVRFAGSESDLTPAVGVPLQSGRVGSAIRRQPRLLQVRVAVTRVVGRPGLLNRGGRWQNVSSQMTTIKPRSSPW